MHIGPADSAQAVVDHCRKIAAFSDERGAITRTFLGPAMRDCLNYFCAWAERIGIRSHIDAAANFRCVLPGTGHKRLVIGSHLDTVPNAGAFDGVLGVVMGMMLAESLAATPPACTIEVVGFSEEEGVRFHRPFIGSTAFVNGLSDEFLSVKDSDGISIQRAIQDFGLEAATVRQPQMDAADGYLEFHIEQGPLLETLGQPLGIVAAIAGQTRVGFDFHGSANHAGTTPMNVRQDAFCAAAEWALLVEKLARSQKGLVATVGSIRVSPNATNVIPGNSQLSLDLRHADDGIRITAFEAIVEAAGKICAERRIHLATTVSFNAQAVPMNPEMIDRVASVLPNAPHMVSGAGHDAMIVAPKIPTAMIFLRSPGGISHHPDESVLVSDIEAGLLAGCAFVQNFC